MDDPHPMVEPGATECPSCGGKLIPIMYGLPMHEAFVAAERGELALGGCIVTGDDPELACAKCGVRYWKARLESS